MDGQGTSRAATRRWWWRCCAVALLSALPLRAAAAISVSAAVESTDVAVGQPFMLTIVVDGAQNVPVPTVEARGFRADYIGPSTQVSFVNGKMSATVTHRYRMIADQEGEFTLGPFVVGYEDQRYETKPIQVRVRPAGARPQVRGMAGDQSLRLVVQPARNEIYVGERVELVLTLYVGDIRVRDLQYPVIQAEGVTVEKFGQPDQGAEIVDGKRYTTVRLRTHLTPVRPGPIDLRTTMSLFVLSGRRALDSIFDQLLPGEGRKVEVAAEPVQITVLPLPDEGRPADFGGAVGSYQFDVDAKPTAVQVGDPITLRMQITGTGNLAAVTPPALAAAPSFRRYDAQPVPGEDAGERRVFEQVIIPNSTDVREIPPLRFSYFDPDARAYQTITRGPIPIAVQPAAANRAAVVDAAPPVQPTPAAEAPLGRDIVYIKEAPGTFHRRGGGWQLVWGVMLALPVALFAAVRAWVRRRERLAGDPRRRRFRAAGREAQRALAAARALDAPARLDATNAALAAYLAAKLDLPPGAVERDRVLERLAAGGVAEPARAEVSRFFALAEEARYAGGAGAATDGVAEAVERIVAALERERGLEARLGVWLAVLLGATLLAGAARAAEPPEVGFFAGNQAYAAGDYDAAIAAYQQARTDSALESGALEFNLGNAFMKQGDLGRAIASYRRAARLLPRDPDVAANLAFARERANLEAEGLPMWQRLLAPFAARATRGELLAAFAVLWWLFWLLLVARLLWPAARAALVRGAAGAALLALVVGISFVVRASAVAPAGAAVVVAAGDTPVRFEPTANGTEHFVVTPGVPVTVREERDGWLLIARADGRRGWVPAETVERVD
jgi:tetratricopeptide (TPR) repeat protein